MMRGRGGSRRQLLCKYVLAYQSKSIQAITQCDERSLFQMRVMMSALIFIWEQNNKRAKQLIDWSTVIFFLNFNRIRFKVIFYGQKDSLINEALLVNDQQILICADMQFIILMHLFV